MIITNIQILESLKKISIPQIENNLAEAKRINNIKINDNKVSFNIKIYQNEAVNEEALIAKCEEVLLQNISTDLNFDIQINRIEEKNTDDANKIRNVIAIASGKGGVGKSTVASNLAIALSKQGHKIGLLDADIFGPSVPKMFGSENDRPGAKKVNGKDTIVPIQKHGVKILSVGFFVKPEDATIWRGPMASNVFKQLLLDADWGELDYLLIDLPPGTSDIHLTLVQSIAVTSAIIVTTPQDVALADVIKGVGMFKSEGIKVPVLGIIENMAWFTPAELPENKYYIFGKGGGKQLAEQLKLPFLGEIPIIQSIREGGDTGQPTTLSEENLSSQFFYSIACRAIEENDKRIKFAPPTEKVHVK